jgi:hypothetical protein
MGPKWISLFPAIMSPPPPFASYPHKTSVNLKALIVPKTSSEGIPTIFGCTPIIIVRVFNVPSTRAQISRLLSPKLLAIRGAAYPLVTLVRAT